MVFGMVTPAAAAAKPTGTTVPWEQVDNSEVTAQNKRENTPEVPQQEDRDPEEIVRVSIVLEQPSVVEKGFSAQGIADNKKAMSYRDKLERKQETMAKTISRKALDGQQLDVVWNLTLAANLISAQVPYGKLEAIRSVPGVKAVVEERQYQPAVVSGSGTADPMMATSGEMTGAFAAWAAGYTGAGTRIAIIDTGLDTDHQSFDNAAFAYALAQEAQKAGKSTDEYVAGLNLLDQSQVQKALDKLNIYDVLQKNGWTESDCYYGEKTPFGFNYVDNSLDITHDNDTASEHGSHVAGIAAANAHIPNGDGTYANALEAVNTQGAAPDAQLLIMKVFGRAGGAYDSDYMAAIEDAIVLGADAINLSLGSSTAGNDRYYGEEVYQDIMDALTKSGAVVNMAAGNAGAWSKEANDQGLPYSDGMNFDIVGSPASYQNSLAVASADNTGHTGAYMKVGDNLFFYTESSYRNDPFTTIAGEYEYVLIDGVGTADEWNALGDVLQGRIAVCARGEIAFSDKANNAVRGGAAATLIYNNQAGTINMDLSDYRYAKPCASITQAEGRMMKNAAQARTTDDGTVYYVGKITVSSGAATVAGHPDYYTVSSFSSMGVPSSLTLKPEITAPGGNIYSVNGAIAGGKSYENMSGTSMATPQVSGMTALVAQYIRENNLTEKTGLSARQLAQSLLMSTATPMEASAGQYWSVLSQGAGLANAADAIASGSYILMGQDATVSYADGKIKAELGDDPDRTGVYTFSFSVNNMTDAEQTYALSADLFTQAIRQANGLSYLDTATARLAAVTSWVVDGKALTPAENMDLLDLNGDGNVNEADAQALLDYATGKDVKLVNADRADLDGDGKLTTYDAYLFFSRLSSGVLHVAAGGKATVTVTLRLTDDQKAALNANTPNGAYIEGYVFAKPLSTAEGVKGITHSIPVLGYFGNWTDASMYDVGDFVSYRYGLETRDPYISTDSNYVAVQYHDDPYNNYSLGGNPLMTEDEYLPQRNAFNNQNGDKILGYGFTAIRNASALRIRVADHTSGQVYSEATLQQDIDGAFYYENGGQWANWGYTMGNPWQGTDADGQKLPEGSTVDVTLELAPEYNVKNGVVDWDALGAGAKMSTQVTIDNTAPELQSVQIDPVNRTLTISAKDNQYLSCVVLYNKYGTEQIGAVSPNQTEPGKTLTVSVGADELPTGDLLLQVYDYAMNVTTYRLHVGQALGIEEPTYDFLGFNVDHGNYMWMGFNKGASAQKDYHGSAAMDTVYIAGTEVDGYVFALQETDKMLYVMPVDDLENRTLIGKVSTSYFTINDLCYNAQDGYLYGIVYIDNTVVRIDKLTGQAEVVGTFGARGDMRTIACDDQGNFYAMTYDYGNATKLYKFTLDTIDAPTLLGSTGYITDWYQSMTWNRTDGMLYWSHYKLGSGDAKDYGYLICMDPNTVTDGVVKTTMVGSHDEPISCLICPGSYTEGTNWYAKTTNILSMTINNESLEMVRGTQKQLTVDIKPWTVTTTDINWTTSDATVATVDTDGTVHAVDNGTAVITGTSAANPNWSVTCKVTVFTYQAKLHAIAEDADGNSSLITWDMDTQQAPEAGIPISGQYTAATYDPSTKTIYAQDNVENVYALHQIDPATGKELSVSPAQSSGLSFDDLTMTSYLADGKGVVGKETTAIFSPADPAKNDGGKVMIDLTHQLDQMFANRIVGMASAGMAKKQYGPTPTYGEEFYALDDLGCLWSGFAYYSSYRGEYYSYSPSQLGNTGIRNQLGYSFSRVNGEYPNSSMLYEPESKTLFISLSRDGKTHVFAAPMVTDSYGRATVGQASLLATCDVPSMHLYSVDYSGLRTEKDTASSVPAGGLTAVSSTAQPASAGTVDHAKDLADVTITAQNAQGVDVTSHNGLVTVTYDPSVMTLDSFTVKAQYSSVIQEEGSLTIGYVDLDGITDIADLHFRLAGKDEASISVAHRQTNDDLTAHTETVTVSNLHPSTEVRDAKAATCTEDGYTGDTYCTVCGQLLEQGKAIPATGHDTELVGAKEATCTEDGYTGDEVCKTCGEVVKKGEVIPALGHKTELVGAKEATCTEDGYTGDEVCTVCGETVKKGEVIPATGHDYKDGKCTNCGETDPNYKPEQPGVKTGDESHLALYLAAASVSLLAAALWLGRKKHLN